MIDQDTTARVGILDDVVKGRSCWQRTCGAAGLLLVLFAVFLAPLGRSTAALNVPASQVLLLPEQGPFVNSSDRRLTMLSGYQFCTTGPKRQLGIVSTSSPDPIDVADLPATKAAACGTAIINSIGSRRFSREPVFSGQPRAPPRFLEADHSHRV